ncbi:multidrug and toxin extrusion protein 2 isoform X4 [Odocoileus virginianus]|uniref:Multidrug and toxin extrusion protein n=1 Tax=Odocoileus virginianus TaxID=9874 RepID=A0ABM4J5F6_ODOVR
MPGCPERPRDRRRSPREAPADRRHPRQTIPSRLVPVGFGAEARTLFILSGPLFLFQMLNFMVYVVSTVFCGHLGTVELAAVTLSVAFVNVCGVSIGFGLSSACDTLMSQSFGSPNKKHVGVILQRGVLVLLLCCLPCWALFLNTQLILLLCRQDPAVSRLAQEYVQVYIPGLLANFLYSLQAKYLQNQGIVWPQVFSGIVGNCVNGLANYVLVSVLGQGVRPAQRARPICPSGHLRGGHRRLHDPHGAQHRGLCPSGDSPGSRRHRASQAISHLRHPLHSGNLAGCGRPIKPPEKQAGPHLHQRRCLYAGVLRGTGRQAFGAVVNAVMYYAIGLPLGVVLTFLVGMGIMGLWLGMLVCVMLATAAFVTYTARMDWKRAAEEAQKHAGLPPLGSSGSMALGPRPGPEKAVVSSVATGSSPGVILTTYSRLGGHLDLLRTPEAIQTLPAPANRLSAKQLAVRRGAALGVAVGSLIVGLVLRVLTARP